MDSTNAPAGICAIDSAGGGGDSSWTGRGHSAADTRTGRTRLAIAVSADIGLRRDVAQNIIGHTDRCRRARPHGGRKIKAGIGRIHPDLRVDLDHTVERVVDRIFRIALARIAALRQIADRIEHIGQILNNRAAMGRIDRCDASVLRIMRADALRPAAKREVRDVAPRIHLCRFPQLRAGGGILLR